jgi:hypothetical protein
MWSPQIELSPESKSPDLLDEWRPMAVRVV